MAPVAPNPAPAPHSAPARSLAPIGLARAATLGCVQGVCEWLPVSSSAHVALAGRATAYGGRELSLSRHRTLEVAVHVGSATALAWATRDTVTQVGGATRAARVAGLGLIAPVIVGAVADGLIERRAAQTTPMVAGLLVGAVGLLVADRSPQTRNAADATAADALLIGAAQAVALLPGVSRRGATLTVARQRHFSRTASSDLSWVAGVPVMLAAAARSGLRAHRRGELVADAPALAAGATASFVTTALVGRRRRQIDRVPYVLWLGWRAIAAALLGFPRAHSRPRHPR